MHVLVIGGTRFVGYQLVWRLLAGGRRVTLFNRGRLPDPFGDRVERLHGDRASPDFARLLAGRRFDATVDFAAYTAADVRGVAEALGRRAGHYVFISSGQVYLVRQDCPRPAREQDYDGPLLPAPADPDDLAQWRYGVEKRAAEDALAAAWREQGLPSTRLRLPMVNGERDHFRRLESYLWRLLDGGPILIPESGPPRLRHVYSGDVVKAIAGLLGDQRTFGQAFNLAQFEAPALVDLVALLADLLGAKARPLAVSDAELHAHQLTPTLISPFSDPWMSDMDGANARLDLDFAPQPLRRYLDKIVSSFLNHPPAEPPPNYANRPAELALAAELTRQGRGAPAPPERRWDDAFRLQEELAPAPPATQEELQRLLEREGIAADTLAPLHSGPDGTIYQLVVAGERALDTWHALRALVAKTGRWPVLLGDEEWAERHRGNIEFSAECRRGSAAEILAASEAINVPAWFAKQIDEVSEHFTPPRGAFPDEAAVRAVLAEHNAWLGAPPDNELDILYQHGWERQMAGRLRGLVPQVHIALAPTRQGWEVPAYLKFGGWNEAPKYAEHVAVLRRWAWRYGAEVLAMKYDTVELLIHRPPGSREEALEAAWELWAYAPDGLPGHHRSAVYTIEGLAAFALYTRIWGFWWD